MNGEIFLDVGAHIGRFSVLASKRFKRVYAFEPHPSNFSLLKENAAINKVLNVVPVNIALSDKNKISFLSEIGLNTGTVKTLDDGKGAGVKCKCYRLDSVMDILNLNPKDIDLIKIDVEGHEIKVLKGSNLVLRESSPMLIIESFDKIRAIKKILSRYGYREMGILDFYNHIFVKK